MENALDKKAIRGDIFKLIVPTVLENMLQILAGIVITAMVGRLMSDDISAQGISNRIYNLSFALFRGLGVGTTVVVATYFGAGNRAKCRRIIEQTYLTSIPVAVLLVMMMFIFARPLMAFFTSNASLVRTAIDYTRITVWATPFMAIISINTAAFNGHGDTKTPMYLALFLNIINIAVGYVLIFGVGGVGGLGIIGAAYTTIISQACGCTAGLVLLYRKRGYFGTVNHGESFFKMDFNIIRDVYATGIPAAFENLFWQLSAILMSKVILGYGSDHYAAYQLGLQAEMFTEMPAMGFVVASTTLSARAIGQRNGPLYRSYYSSMMRMAMLVAIPATAALFLAPVPLMKLLTDKAILHEIGSKYVFIMGFAQVPQVLSKVYNGFIRSSGGKRVPMYISFIGIWLIRVPLVMLIGWVLKLDIIYIWFAISLDQISRMALSMLYMKRRDVKHTVERMIAADEAQGIPVPTHSA